MTERDTDTWNIAEVEILAGQARLRRRFRTVCCLWMMAVTLVIAASAVGLSAAEAGLSRASIQVELSER